jgi:hypothetical protein
MCDPTSLTVAAKEVEQFLDAGSPPVYMGFGSMPLKDPKVALTPTQI